MTTMKVCFLSVHAYTQTRRHTLNRDKKPRCFALFVQPSSYQIIFAVNVCDPCRNRAVKYGSLMRQDEKTKIIPIVTWICWRIRLGLFDLSQSAIDFKSDHLFVYQMALLLRGSIRKNHQNFDRWLPKITTFVCWLFWNSVATPAMLLLVLAVIVLAHSSAVEICGPKLDWTTAKGNILLNGK
jgi:hypothetical protein